MYLKRSDRSTRMMRGRSRGFTEARCSSAHGSAGTLLCNAARAQAGGAGGAESPAY